MWWWHDAMAVTVICLALVSLITALVSAVLVIEPAMAARCDRCGAAMIDSQLDGAPVCPRCPGEHDSEVSHRPHDRADRELTTASSRA